MVLLRSVQDHALDLDAGKARPEQLILQDDPSFLPEFALPPPELFSGIDLSFTLDVLRWGESQSLTPFDSRQSSQSSHVGGYGLVLPSSSPDRPAGGALEGDDVGQGDQDMQDIDNILQLDDPDFAFGEDGDIIELSPGSRAPVAPATPVAAGRKTMHSDASASSQVRREHAEGQQRGDQVTNILKAAIGDPADMNLPNHGDDIPADGASPPAVDQQASEHSVVVESSSSVAAPMRRKQRSAKPLPRDTVLELRNNELLSWNANYVQNMKDAAQHKIKHHIQQQAKKNAEHYVWGAGIGGLGRDEFGARGPLGQFMGDRLFELINGMSRTPKGRPKRGRDSGIDEATQEEARRKRQKTTESEGEIGRGRDNEGVFMLGGDEDIELPREAASALDTQQIFSAMPWNISASKRGSSAVPLSGRVIMTSEQGKQGSHAGSRAGSRMISASPLLRRSTGHPGDFEALQSLDSDAFGGDDFAYAIPTSDPAEAEENVVHPPLRVREALSAEEGNFFAFVAEAITEKRERSHANVEDEIRDLPDVEATEVEQITFEELLPPSETSKMVACQGFLMVLSLGTKGMLDVQQSTAFDDIALKLTEKAKAMQIVEVDYGEEEGSQKHGDAADISAADDLDGEESSVTLAGSEDEPAEPDDRHFQEQMAAGHAAAGDEDDNDSLYDSH
ncbi:hypothetical protein G6514_008890 [Epicoccum nigrum]|nr:hypothetical protein G6514_008890 [Epicoccum nigrum]